MMMTMTMTWNAMMKSFDKLIIIMMILGLRVQAR